MEEKLKTSGYNFLFDLEDGTHMAFNAMSGAFAKIGDGDYETVKFMIENPQKVDPQNDNEEKLWEDTKRAGFVIKDDVDELELIQFRANCAKYSHELFYLTIMPTLNCNFACPYCYEEPVKGKMSPEIQEGVIRWAENRLVSARVMKVGWFGGEPLMALDVMRNLTRRFKELCEEKDVHYFSNITTNAYYLSQKVIDELPDFAINLVQVTLDGPPITHNKRRVLRRNGKGTFDRILNNIVRLCETIENVALVLRVNFDAASIDHIPELFPLIPDSVKRKTEIYFRQVFPPPQWWDANEPTKSSSVERNTDYVESVQLYKLAQDQGFRVLLNNYSPRTGYCEADYLNHMVIDHKANIHKCTVAFDEEHRVGYITPEGKAVMEVPILAKWLLRQTVDRPNCRKCKILPLCMGGCNFNTLCSKGRVVCSTTLNTQFVVDNLRMLYKNTQLWKSQKAVIEESQPA